MFIHKNIYTFAVVNNQTLLSMNLYRLTILAFTAFVSVAIHGQLFTPLGLGIEKSERGEFRPQMHIEGDILYVCTSRGLYSKDLSSKESAWQLVGFKDIPLQDYVRRGDDILALRFNVNGDFLLLSHDGGKTYEDITPDVFREHTGWKEVLTNLVQHPTDPNTLLVSSVPMGLFQSLDFGQTWCQLTDIIPRFIGYHPLKPEVIYESGEDDTMSPFLNLSYDGGKTWNSLWLPFPGDNCVHRIAFHPSDPNRWIVGGEGAVYTSMDNGHTWDAQNYWGDKREAYWYYTVFDNENNDIVYMVGRSKGKIDVMFSVDGGKTWSIPHAEPTKKPEIEYVDDLQQYGDKLLIYTETDVYEISKAKLLAQATSVRNISDTTIVRTSFFSLSGHRLITPPTRKGIYIRDGKKVVK